MPERAADVLPLVRPAVRDILERSAAFRELTADRQRAIAQDAAKIAGYLVAPDGVPANTLHGAVILVPSGGLMGAVEFPNFVAGLIDGVFAAVVDASIQQMNAYAQLLKDASRLVDGFEHDAASHDTVPASATRLRVAAARQQQLSTMVLMGINRIVVTN